MIDETILTVQDKTSDQFKVVEEKTSLFAEKISENVGLLKPDPVESLTQDELKTMRKDSPQFSSVFYKSATYSSWDEKRYGKRETDTAKRLSKYELRQLEGLPKDIRDICTEITIDRNIKTANIQNVESKQQLTQMQINFVKNHPLYSSLLEKIKEPKNFQLLNCYTAFKEENISFPYNVALTQALVNKYGSQENFKEIFKKEAILQYEHILKKIKNNEVDIPVVFLKTDRSQTSNLELLTQNVLRDLGIKYDREVLVETDIGKRYFDFLLDGKGVIEVNGAFHNFPEKNKEPEFYGYYATKWIFSAAISQAKLDFLQRNNVPCLVVDSENFNKGNVEEAIKDFVTNSDKYITNSYYNRTEKDAVDNVILKKVDNII